jgi:aminoglycoside phosphotransferase (APT) family kinase protein
VREAIDAMRGELDEATVSAVWDEALGASPWERPPAWVHGDLYDGNLLARDGRLCAVIDWGGAGVGDPACDLIVAWSLFSGESRDVFRADLDVDDATWVRGRGWALSVALMAIPYYRETNPVIVANSWRRIDELVAERSG